jgi:hypothetical protein
MGFPYEVKVWIKDPMTAEWRWEQIYYGPSLLKAILRLHDLRKTHEGHARCLEIHG